LQGEYEFEFKPQLYPKDGVLEVNSVVRSCAEKDLDFPGLLVHAKRALTRTGPGKLEYYFPFRFHIRHENEY